MRTVEITKDLKVEIKPLKRRQIKALREHGFNISSASILTIQDEKWDDFIDAIVNAYAPGQAEEILKQLDDLPNNEYRKVCRQLLAETWGSGEEEGN